MKQINAYLVAMICMAAGCTFTPDIPTSSTKPVDDDAWPSLLPASEIRQLDLDTEGRSDLLTEEAAELAKRAAALKAKATALDQPILSEQDRARLLQAASDGI